MYIQIASRRVDDNFQVKTRQKTPFIYSMIKIMSFTIQLAKQEQLEKFQPFLKTPVFSTPGATL